MSHDMTTIKFDNYGRTALAWPTSDLRKIEEWANEFNGSVLTSYLTLPTPGKEGMNLFTLKKNVSPTETLLDKAMKNDQSEAWHEKQAKRGNYW